MGIKEFFQTIQWGATLQVAAIRIVIASILWPLLFIILGNTKAAEFFPMAFGFILVLAAFIAIAIPAIGLTRANVPYVGLAALPAWMVVVADPLVKLLHSKRPDLVPVDEFKLINPPVLAIFQSRENYHRDEDLVTPGNAQSPVENSSGATKSSGLFDEFIRSAVGHDSTRAIELWRSSSMQIIDEYRRVRDDEDGSAWYEGNYALFETLIWNGVKTGDVDATRTAEALISAGVLLNEPDRSGWTPVGLLAMIGNLELLQLAIQSGGDVNAGDENALACLFGDRELDNDWTKVADLLVKAGINVNGSPGQAPPVFAALSRNHRDAIRFLVANGADLNRVHYIRRSDFSGTAMHYSVLAAFADDTNLETGNLLVELGGDPTVKNKEGFGAIDAFFASGREPTGNVKALVTLYSATESWRQSSLYLSNASPSAYNPVRQRTLSDQTQERLWNEIAGTEVRFRIGDKVEVIRRGGFYGNRVDLTLQDGGEQVSDHEMIALPGAVGIIIGWDQNHGNHWKAVIDFEPGTWEEADNYGRTRSLGRCRGSLFPEALRIVETEEEIKKGTGANNNLGTSTQPNTHCQDLINCIENGQLEAVQSLLDYEGVWKIENYRDAELDNPLTLAIEECGSDGITDILKILSEKKFLINEIGEYNHRPILSAIRLGNLAALNLLIDNGAELNWVKIDESWPPALASAAIYMGKIPKDRLIDVIELLSKRGGEVNSSEGPALHYAMSANDRNGMRLAVLEKLIEIGADVNQVAVIPSLIRPAGSHIGTPIFSYYASGIEAVRFLLDNGADLDVKNNHGENAIEFFEDYEKRAPSEKETVDEIISLLRGHAR